MLLHNILHSDTYLLLPVSDGLSQVGLGEGLIHEQGCAVLQPRKYLGLLHGIHVLTLEPSLHIADSRLPYIIRELKVLECRFEALLVCLASFRCVLSDLLTHLLQEGVEKYLLCGLVCCPLVAHQGFGPVLEAFYKGRFHGLLAGVLELLRLKVGVDGRCKVDYRVRLSFELLIDILHQGLLDSGDLVHALIYQSGYHLLDTVEHLLVDR